MKVEIREVEGIPCTRIELDRGAAIVAGTSGIAAYPHGIAWYEHRHIFRVRSTDETEPDYYIVERVIRAWSYGLRGLTPVDPDVIAAEALAE